MTITSSPRIPNPGRAYALLLHNLCLDLSIPSELTKTVCALARSRSYTKLVRVADEITTQLYGDADEHFRFNQLAFFIRKTPFVDKGLTPELTAIAKFNTAEHRMKLANRKMRAVRQRLEGHKPVLERQWRSMAWILKARELISRVLGPLDLTEVYGECYMGDGSAVGVHGQATHVIKKMRNLSCTPSAKPYLLGALWCNPHMRRVALDGDFSPFANDCLEKERLKSWVDGNLTIVGHNEVDFVPKDAKTHRSIALEPSGNGFLQLGAGWAIARLLRKVGQNIQDQRNNQLFALFGSECYDYVGAIATIDLSAASDSICTELVRLLLPADWWVFLNSIRSPSYKLKGGPETRYEKFASMGNGFCFPLETLIFWAVCKTATLETGDTLLAVYGDDIALPKGAALLAIERLRYCGFRTNNDKTFVHGPFRESCGTDYFGGRDVRPFVLDYLPEHARDLVKIANGLQARGRSFPHTVKSCMELTHPDHLLLKPHPTGAVDDAIEVPLDCFMGNGSAKRWDRDRYTWNFKVWRSDSSADDIKLSPAEEMLALLHGASPGKGYTRRNAPPGPEGHPVLPLRFTARTRRSWYLPAVVRDDESQTSAPT